MRIFLVENDQDTLKVLKRQLERLGHEVTTACTVADALDGILAQEYDFLLSDIGLPDGDGWELLQKVREVKPIFAVAMSGYGSASDRQTSVEAGFREHLLKPFSLEQLKGALQKAYEDDSHLTASKS